LRFNRRVFQHNRRKPDIGPDRHVSEGRESRISDRSEARLRLRLVGGRAAAAILAATHADLYAAVGIHSGLACGAASDLPSAFVAMRQGGRSKIGDGGPPVPTIVFHCDRDTTVHSNNGERIVERSADERLRVASPLPTDCTLSAT
jgi:Esterase PHB depolymerase